MSYRLNFINLTYRCASHTLDLIAKKDTDLSKFDAKGFTKKNAFRQAWTKLQGFWNKIGQSISASEKSHAAFGKQFAS